MKRGQFSAEGFRDAPGGLKWACYALGLAVAVAACGAVAGWGPAAQAKLSEDSHQVAYSAGLGPHALSTIPVSHRMTSVTARCSKSTTTVGSRRLAYAAFVTKAAVIRRGPRADSPVVARLGRLDVNGFRVVLGVTGAHSSGRCKTDWYRVQLSVVPNGTVGWVRAWAVQTYRVRSRIVIDLSRRRLSLYRSGKLELETPVAVGSPATPTPRGRYFVNERYALPDATGPFGPAALGMSAHSDVLQDVWVEDGPIGIHGTNEPWSIGRAVSHGCIRVANDVMRRLFRLAPAGTPIVVTT
ncbi:MAG: L,D-transpeptidase family protein [Gaiellaceae bacterium]